MKFPVWFHRLGSPPTFYRFAGRLMPWCFALAALIGAWGLYGGLVLAPPDYQQSDSFRIMYVHVPAAWMSMAGYAFMAVCAFVALVWRMKLAELMVLTAAPIGAAFTLITLVTGSIWGKPMWGTWWDWDPRLTSELVLLFLYLGVIALAQAFEDRRAGRRAACLLALIGVVNIPIIHYAVTWWNSLHQGPTVRVFGESTIHPDMLWPLLAMTVASKLYFAGSLFARTRAALLTQEFKTHWVQQELSGDRHV
ncbi:MAG: heme ABC transporter permease [Xanthomonadales bacterium]|nr:heme ABC transporter permease [Xanthomonadales bacterium]